MGWQSPQPGHQSAGSLRKHLRELGRQVKGADRHYTQVTQSTGASPGGCAPADSPGTHWVQHRPLRHPQHHGPQDRARAVPAPAAAALPPRCLATTPTLQSHARSSLAPSHHCHRLSHSEGAEKRKPCLQKSHHYPAVTQHTQPTEQGKQTALHSSHAALASCAKSHQQSSLPFTGRV